MKSRLYRGKLIRPRMEILEDRSTPAVVTFGGDSQHTGISEVASQPIQAIHWQATVDSFFSGSFGHYGAPLVTDANTVILSHKTGPTATPNFHVLGKNGNSGEPLWDVATDWTATNYSWFPPYQPVLAAATNRVYYAGNGGTIYYRTNPDSTTGTIAQLAFYGTLSDYFANQATYNSTVKVDTPLSVDSQGNVFFGFRVSGTNPAGLTSGIARIAPDGTATWVSARAASGNDIGIDLAAPNSAMVLSNDESTLYVCVRDADTANYGRLLALNATTLATQFNSGVLKDPRNANNASINNNSTSSPIVAPDGRVFFGVLANPNNGSRGWMLQFSPDLATQYTPGGFGWDTTPSIVPTSMVPQYTGLSPYLIFTKYNNYAFADGDGTNKIAILDPFDTQVDPHTSANGLLIMKEVLTKIGPTSTSNPNYPNAVREWCINSAAVDPATSSVIVNSEDGHVYRWHLPTNTLSESILLTAASLQPYTPTVIGVDGSIYAIEDGILFALGKTPGLSIADATAAIPSTATAITVSLDFPRTSPITVHFETADASAVAGLNYTATSGDLTFTPGQMTQTINVPVNPASVTGAGLSFLVNLTSPGNADLADGQGQVTLLGRPPRVQSVIVNGGAGQRSQVTSIAVHFDQIVTAPASAFQLVRQGDNALVTVSASINNSGLGTVATLSFVGGAVEFGSLADGRYTLTMESDAVGNVAGQLDGNADGAGGDDYVFAGNSLFRLFGDSEGNATVDGADFSQFGDAFGSSGLSPFDFDANLTVDGTDLSQFGARFGLTL